MQYQINPRGSGKHAADTLFFPYDTRVPEPDSLNQGFCAT